MSPSLRICGTSLGLEKLRLVPRLVPAFSSRSCLQVCGIFGLLRSSWRTFGGVESPPIMGMESISAVGESIRDIIFYANIVAPPFYLNKRAGVGCWAHRPTVADTRPASERGAVSCRASGGWVLGVGVGRDSGHAWLLGVWGGASGGGFLLASESGASLAQELARSGRCLDPRAV